MTSNMVKTVCHTRIIPFVLVFFLFVNLVIKTNALSPCRPRELPEPPPLPYSDEEINIIANVVNGEVGGITGSVLVTYADGAVEESDGQTLRRIHARVVDNQVNSALFPDTVRSCAAQYWSSAYTGTSWRSSDQWQKCRRDVLCALYGLIDVPDNVFAATCDPYFADRYTGYSLWAKIHWDTGYCSGTFYYYAYD